METMASSPTSPPAPLTPEQEWVVKTFQVAASDFTVAGKASPQFNCIAHAAGDHTQPWWPCIQRGIHWPQGVPLAQTLDAFEKAYATKGYARYNKARVKVPADGDYVALFVDASGNVTHAAHLAKGASKWTSKCGQGPTIEHDIGTLQGPPPKYGTVQRYLRRGPEPAKQKKKK